MMLNMTETDYENWRDDLRCGGQEEYDTQYSAASLYEGGWRARDLPDLIEQFNLTGDEAERIYMVRGATQPVSATATKRCSGRAKART